MANDTSTRPALDQGLLELRENLLRLFSLTELQIQRAVEALKSRSETLAREVVEKDARANELRYAVEHGALRLIATQQPAARDLRYILACIHIAVELERMADHASGIAEISLRIGQQPLVKPLIDIPRMQGIACAMLRNATSAFINLDGNSVVSIAKDDDELDQLYTQVLRELLTYMMQDRSTTHQATMLLWVAHNLERIGDRIVNICERIQFAAQGELGDYRPESA